MLSLQGSTALVCPLAPRLSILSLFPTQATHVPPQRPVVWTSPWGKKFPEMPACSPCFLGPVPWPPLPNHYDCVWACSLVVPCFFFGLLILSCFRYICFFLFFVHWPVLFIMLLSPFSSLVFWHSLGFINGRIAACCIFVFQPTSIQLPNTARWEVTNVLSFCL